MKLSDIFKDSDYKLSQFLPSEIEAFQQYIFIKKTAKNELPYLKCLVRDKEIQLKPEEAIRQLYLMVLNQRYGYPLKRMEVEYSVSFGREKKKADIVIFDQDRPTVPYIIIELKKTKLKDGKEQLKSYCNATGAPIAVWTNGEQISYYQRKDPNYFEDITDIPNVNQTLADILNEKFTLEDLIKKDKLVNEKKSLKTLIEEMEDEVLANAGVDVFEEIFKLIFAKLYDEWLSGQGSNKTTRLLEFRNTGQTETALKNKAQGLFDQATKKWEGVFSEDTKITLTPSHLSVCISSLENVKLFNSNLDVVDEAFEYLINKSSKGEKGQFFTPRYVIDMSVKMLNPKEDEHMIDTAAGSSGFPVHTIFHVWKQILTDEGIAASNLFSLENKPYRCRQYVENKVFALDFDEKAVRVARTLNLIAGDGETNVLHLNTLDFERWDEWTKQEQWNDVYNNGFKRLKKLQKDKGSYQEFNFDVLMANPPFAGDIKESRLIQKYDLSVKSGGKRQTKIGRDILFIERNLDFLKPGGRMAIVLPQGRFNNSSDKYIRDYIAEQCRILAVIGLHGNTFKPHTGTKTSVLLVQKWDDQLCPKVEDYQIFFATQRKSGKDNSGEKIYTKNANNEAILDSHGHLIVDHDLFNHEGLTEDGIAEAFIEFAKKEGLSFFDCRGEYPFTPKFDNIKYQLLMDKLEAIDLKLSEVLKDNNSFRFDSEYFKKDYFKNLELLKKYSHGWVLFNSIIKIITGGATPLGSEYPESGIKFLRVQNIMQNYIDDSDLVFISEEYHQTLKRSQLLENDILLTITGVSYGKSAVVTKEFIGCNINQHSVKITLANSSFLPLFMSTFLNCNFGKLQSDKNIVGVTRPALDYQSIKKFVIPLVTIEFQNCISKIVNDAFLTKEKSKIIYQEAEKLLLSELGLQDWQPTEDNIAEKSFSESFLASGRLDAEYYQPFYEDIENRIKSKEFVLVEDICSHINYGSVPTSPYTENGEGIPYLKGLNLKNTEIVVNKLDRIINTEDLPAKFYTKKGDIIISQMGTVGNCGVIENEHVGWIFASFTIRIRIKDKDKFNPHFVALYIEKLAKPYYLMRNIAQASVRQNTDLPTIKNMYIPVINQNMQNFIADKMQESKNLRQQSKQLLEIAKIGVEKAIETAENTATNWINGELDKMEVKLD